METDTQPAAWYQACVCGRTFSLPQAYTYHARSCQKTQKRLASALDRAKSTWQATKRRKLEKGLAVRAAASVNRDVSDNNSDYILESIEIQEGVEDQSGLMGRDRAHIIPIAHLENNLDAQSHSPTLEGNDEDNNNLDASIAERRGRRQDRRLPKRYRDILPEPPAALPPPPTPPLANPEPVTALPVLPPPLNIIHQDTKTLKSRRNLFGLFRLYHAIHFPEHDPDKTETVSDELISTLVIPSSYSYYPYPSQSSFLLGEWYWNDRGLKTMSSFKNLVKIVGHPDFRPEEIATTNWQRIDSELLGDSTYSETNEDVGWDDKVDAGWTVTTIKIQIPFHRSTPNPGSQELVVGALHHRKLVSVIREKILSPAVFPHFHLEPYELYWQPDEAAEPVRVHGEMYSSEAFIEAHREVQNSPQEPGCELPRIVVALMFFSDATHLTAFSDAKLWPVYLGFGNESKYQRSKPSSHAFEHIAYFESLPAEFKDFVKSIGGKGPNSAYMAHCHREIYHSQWSTILDDEFLHAYVHGIIIDCCDGIRRRFYPRIFTYSADYPEKVIIASIRNLGRCPCPRCLIPLNRVDNLGKPRDMSQRVTLARIDDANRRSRVLAARRIIYEQNYVVNSTAVENLLRDESLVPTINAFSDKLALFGFCLFLMLVVDFMHEFELGVWRAVFIHLLRILDCVDTELKHELDQRFRAIPAFGQDSIRKIRSNPSELKKMTAHDYENLLQCAIPVFDGLLPEPHNTRVLELLFDLAHWHGLAKLRMHTDNTLDILSQATTSLGNSLRDFKKKTCSVYETREMERERSARERRQGMRDLNIMNGNNVRKPKTLNLNTYKFHALGDYVSTIRRFGTTDSYSTQSGELEHRTSKGRLPRTNGRSIPQQLSNIERRQRRIRAIHERRSIQLQESEKVVDDPRMRYNMGKTQNSPLHLPTFLRENDRDPAVKNFSLKLRNHILPRILEILQNETPSPLEPSTIATTPHLDADTSLSPHEMSTSVFFKADRIYQHRLTRFHFTTYDMLRATDLINATNSRCNIMLLAENAGGSENTLHPFLPGMRDYKARSLDFLWVRWYEVIDPVASSWGGSTLDRVRFPRITQDDAFGFVDPQDVLRGCHVIPAFANGKKHTNNIGFSYCAKDGGDYFSYYIGRFSERDLLMRYHWGLGVGHLHAHCRPPAQGSPTVMTTQKSGVTMVDADQLDGPSNGGGDALAGSKDASKSYSETESNSDNSDLRMVEEDEFDGLDDETGSESNDSGLLTFGEDED